MIINPKIVPITSFNILNGSFRNHLRIFNGILISKYTNNLYTHIIGVNINFSTGLFFFFFLPVFGSILFPLLS